MRLIEFDVIDNGTGREPNCELIAITEEWANNLMPCDIDSFAVTEDGRLVLIDDCGNCSFAPSDRFTVKVDPNSLRPKGRWEMSAYEVIGTCKWNVVAKCTNCHHSKGVVHVSQIVGFSESTSKEIAIEEAKRKNYGNFCHNCGADMREETK